MSINIEEYFKYHPPTTEERKQKHNAVNEAALAFALVLQANVQDEDLLKMCMYSIQQARMIANQGITMDDLKT